MSIVIDSAKIFPGQKIKTASGCLLLDSKPYADVR
jgi:hypothetical protein